MSPAENDLRELRTLLCQTFGYDQLWRAPAGGWIFERQGKPGYIEVLPLTAALLASGSPPK